LDSHVASSQRHRGGEFFKLGTWHVVAYIPISIPDINRHENFGNMQNDM